LLKSHRTYAYPDFKSCRNLPMIEAKAICTIYCRKGLLDDEYTLYEDGKVLRYYDEHQWSLNQEKWFKATEIADYLKQELLNECPEELKEKARELLGL
jgi:hypothetical protein